MAVIKRLNYFEVTDLIKKLEGLTASGASPDLFLPMLKRLIKGYPVSAITLNNEYFYRARWNEKGRLFDHVKELIYPPEECVLRKGRLNDIGESVLYAALCELGTIIELRPDFNKFFTISRISSLSDTKPLFFPVGFTDRYLPTGFANQASRCVREYLNGVITKPVVDECDYNSSIALSRQYLRTKLKGYPIDDVSVAYPSVESRKISNVTTYNVAMLPKIFDKHYFVDRVTIYVLVQESDQYRLLEVNSGVVDELGCIQWVYSFEKMKERVSRGEIYNGSLYKSIIGLERSL